MNPRNLLRNILWLILGIATLSLLLFHHSLYGLLCQRLPWEEDALIGKPLSDLERMLTAKGRSLAPVDSLSFSAITEKPLQQNQRALQFNKGNDYNWFYCGTALNVGYVVVEKLDGERISAILHHRSVDSL